MCENEYVAHAMVRERIREAEARGVFNAMVRHALSAPRSPREGTGGERPRPTWLELWRQASADWATHLALPKIWNRL
jgi:hypothetical protein